MRNLIACGLLALCACATTTEERRDRPKEMVLYSTPGAPKPEGKMVCQVEYPTGSNIAHRVCRYQNQSDWTAERAQQTMRELQQRSCSGLNCSQP
jgi:hypothetical protein